MVGKSPAISLRGILSRHIPQNLTDTEKGDIMKKRFSHRLLSLGLALMMVFSLTATALAASCEDFNQAVVPSDTTAAVPASEYMGFAYSIAPTLPDLDSSMGEIFISQPVEILNTGTAPKYSFFLFSGDTCVGQMIVTNWEGEFYSTFVPEQIPSVSAAYSANAPITLIAGDDGLVLQTDTSAELIAGISYGEDADAALYSDVPFEKVSSDKGVALELSRVATPYGNISTNYGTLDVPAVANTRDPYGTPLCWAAAAASIIMYRSNTVGLTAYGVYSEVLPFNPSPNQGSVAWVEKAYDIHHLSHTYRGSGRTYDETVAIISGNTPIYMSLSNGNTAQNHAVVLCGYQHAPGGYYSYQVMDPSSDTTTQRAWITCYSGSSMRGSVVYTPAWDTKRTYTFWYNTIW